MQNINKELKQLFDEERWQELASLAKQHLDTVDESYLFLGIASLEMHQENSAIENINKFLTIKKPANDLAYFYLGRSHEIKKEVLVADQWYEKAFSTNKNEIKYFIYRVTNLFNNKMFEEIKLLSHEILEYADKFEFFPLLLMTTYQEAAIEENTGDVPEEIISLCARFVNGNSDITTTKKYIDFLLKYQKKSELRKYIAQLKNHSKQGKQLFFYAEAKISELEENLEKAEFYHKKGLEDSFNELNALPLIDVLFKLRKIDEAIKKAKLWSAKNPNSAEFLNKLASLYFFLPNKTNLSIGKFKEALTKASANREDLLWNLSLALLSAGNLEEGWQAYRAREGTLLKRKFEAKLWNGEKLKDHEKVMVWSEQGVGDHIMFATILKDFSSHIGDGKIIFETDPRLMPILQRSFPNIEIRKNPRLKRDLSPYVTDYNYHIPLGSLAVFFRKKISDFTGKKILVESRELREEFEKRLNHKKIKIGIIWRSQLRDKVRDINYLNHHDVAMLLNIAHQEIEWVNLQYGECDDEIEKIRHECGVNLLRWNDVNLKDDFDATAALISCLDLVISPSSSVLQLAGALGVRTWSFNPYPLWTMFNQSYYPWSDSVRVYQVEFPNSMKYTIPSMLKDLENWLSTGTPPPSKTQVVIDLEEAKKQLDLMIENTVNHRDFLSEQEAERELATGTVLEEIQPRIASVRLEKKIQTILKNPDQYLVTSEPRPKLGGHIEEIKNLLSQQSEQDLLFEIQTNFQQGAKTLILSFQGNINYALPFSLVTPYLYPKFAWTKIANEFDNVSLLQIRDSWQMWYQVGPLGSCLLTPEKAVDKWIELIIPKIEQSKAEKIICVGTSAGASAAIQFGAKLNADAVVTISPQARPLDAEWEENKGGFNFFQYKSDWRKQLKDNFCLPNLDLKPCAEKLGDKLHIIVPKLNKTDVIHANYLTRNNPNIHLYRSTGKNHGDVNKELVIEIIKSLI